MAYEDYRREVRDDINVSNGNTTPSGNLSDGSSTGKKIFFVFIVSAILSMFLENYEIITFF